MAAKNDITGDTIQTKASSSAYRDNWESIFGKKEPEPILEPKKEEDNIHVNISS